MSTTGRNIHYPAHTGLNKGMLENNVANVCQVVPYTECSLGMEAQPFTSSLLAPKLFVEKVCSQGKKVRWQDQIFANMIEMKINATGDPPCENAS